MKTRTHHSDWGDKNRMPCRIFDCVFPYHNPWKGYPERYSWSRQTWIIILSEMAVELTDKFFRSSLNSTLSKLALSKLGNNIDKNFNSNTTILLPLLFILYTRVSATASTKKFDTKKKWSVFIEVLHWKLRLQIQSIAQFPV